MSLKCFNPPLHPSLNLITFVYLISCWQSWSSPESEAEWKCEDYLSLNSIIPTVIRCASPLLWCSWTSSSFFLFLMKHWTFGRMDFRLIVSCVLISTLSNSLDQHWKSFFFFLPLYHIQLHLNFNLRFRLSVLAGSRASSDVLHSCSNFHRTAFTHNIQYLLRISDSIDARTTRIWERETRKNIFMHKWLKGSILSRIFSRHFFASTPSFALTLKSNKYYLFGILTWISFFLPFFSAQHRIATSQPHSSTNEPFIFPNKTIVYVRGNFKIEYIKNADFPLSSSLHSLSYVPIVWARKKQKKNP